VLLFFAVLSTVSAPRAAAQQPQPVVAPAPAQTEFFSRTNFHLNAAWIRSASSSALGQRIADERFTWDTFWGGSIDIVDYVNGRLAVLIDYEAVLGSEFQAFDPNQGNYTLEASASARLGPDTELVGMLHHVSRHLSDRAKVRNPVAFNELGARLLHRVDFGGSTLDISAEAGRTIARAYVDYSWLAALGLLARVPVSNRVGVFAHAVGHLVGVNGTVPDRERQSGGLVETGVRIQGSGGAMELFIGFEKRLDADPLDRQSQHWMLAGFRLLSR
jgi:hypothetical protein